MVVVGADVHKRTHTLIAVDEVGRELGHKTFPATTVGHQDAVRRARERLGRDLVWATEDCRHLSARLERDLLTAGQAVVRVPPKMMAEQRRIARTRGKSDPIDAAAVARAFLRQQELADRLAGLAGIVAEIARDELADVIDLTRRIDDLERRIAGVVSQTAPSLLAKPGAGALTAAKLAGETAGVGRFKSEAAFARHPGTIVAVVGGTPCGWIWTTWKTGRWWATS